MAQAMHQATDEKDETAEGLTFDPDLQAEIEKVREEFELEIIDPESDSTFDDDLRKRQKNCYKNPNHDQFIPAKDFKIEHLPLQWQEPWVYQVIKKEASIVVKLTTTYTSLNRPKGYCCYKVRGTSLIRFGTGLAIIDKGHIRKKAQPCPLTDCHEIVGPHLVTPEFKVHTASHVVFDTSEALQTKVIFSLENDKEPENRIVITTQGIHCEASSGMMGDNCILKCVSHDLNLFHKVLSAQSDTKESPSPLCTRHREPLVVILSNPHGCSKQISFGEWTGIKPVEGKEILKMMRKAPARSFLEYFQARFPGSPFIASGVVQTLLQQCDNDPELTAGELFGEGLLSNAVNVSPIGFHNILELVNPSFLVAHSPILTNAVEAVIPGMRITEHVQRWGQHLQHQSLLHEVDMSVGTSYMLYSTPTCPGSSGAPVIVFFDEDNGYVAMEHLASHFGTKDKVNTSGFLPPLINSPALKRLVKRFSPPKKIIKEPAATVMDIPLD